MVSSPTQENKLPYISIWWNDLVKPEIIKYFAAQGKETIKMKCGFLDYPEFKLRRQYEIANTSGIINNFTINSLKSRIETVRNDMVKGVKIRSRLQDAVQEDFFYIILFQNHINRICVKYPREIWIWRHIY